MTTVTENKQGTNGTEASRHPAAAASPEKTTVIEEGTELSGRLKSKCALVINGAVEGELDAPSVVVSASGSLTGSAKVRHLRSSGKLSGHFEAENVELGGSVGNKTTIRAKTIEAKLAGGDKDLEVTFGECKLEVGDAPAAGGEASRASTKPESKKAK